MTQNVLSILPVYNTVDQIPDGVCRVGSKQFTLEFVNSDTRILLVSRQSIRDLPPGKCE